MQIAKNETVVRTISVVLTLTEDEAAVLYSIVTACAANDKDTEEFSYKLFTKLSELGLHRKYESKVHNGYLHTHKLGYAW